ncbi:hypothetical protein VC83_08089 [Pseudogymnoascus destructans]|uniref:Uncharacterized protein n=2 Tax=Pseudogymnoascus destructans TaxID=655981 RepID=L8FX35_PSED2|nr:uncharacterized protein VC83_08089 [Pseudogymnoascus destructans]ELR04280.1 hypothetical protein, variant [Pseudogymnoascus destructans 20631-21]ELR04281.1 hypothetical protein GMDG_06677 [Pseudogymnoascus destructans 20631-21]OAF55984.1 hypothetical protein VC83_08089 [Pseudogymnoascus destructans]
MVTSTSFTESAVINAPISVIWPLIKLNKFATFYTAIQKSELAPATPDERETVRWNFENRTIDDERRGVFHHQAVHVIQHHQVRTMGPAARWCVEHSAALSHH